MKLITTTVEREVSVEVPETVLEAYRAVRAYFDRPGAVLAKFHDSDGDVDVCRYRTSEGNKCAVGCVIPDELYEVEFEGKNIEAVANMLPGKPLRAMFENKEVLSFYGSAQQLHDERSEDAKDFVGKLDAFTYGYLRGKGVNAFMADSEGGVTIFP